MCLEFLPIALLKRLLTSSREVRRRFSSSPAVGVRPHPSKDFNTSAALEPVNARPQNQARHIY